MKKMIFCLLATLAVMTGISFTGDAATIFQNERAVIQVMDAAPSSLKDAVTVDYVKKDLNTVNLDIDTETAHTKDLSVTQKDICLDVPLTYEEQVWLQEACEEFDVPYALALGLIEKETGFQNVIGDNGASTGYMQIQKKWHWSRMNRLGVTNLLDPIENFRVGCDFLSELYECYKNWSVALTVYNMGHNPGYITDYANTVMGNYAQWQSLIETYDEKG